MGKTILLLAVVLIAAIRSSEDPVNGETKIDIWDGKEWVAREVRTLDDLKDFSPAQEITLSKYGARLDMKVRATGFFRTEKVDGRWWLVDGKNAGGQSTTSQCH